MIPFFFFLTLVPGFSRELTLNEAINSALENAGEVKLGKLDFAAAGYGVKEAKAARLPVIDITASASIMTSPPEGITIAKGELGYSPTPTSQVPVALPDEDYVLLEDPENTYFSFQTTLQQPLFSWGKIKAGIELASLERDISGLSLQQVRREVRRDTRLAYFAVVLAKESRELLTEAQTVLQQVLEDRRNGYGEGVLNLQSVLEAEANLSMVTAEKTLAAAGYESSLEGLQLLTGLDVDEKKLISGFTNDLPDLNTEALQEQVAKESPELEMLYVRLRQSMAGEKLLKGDALFKPDLGLDITLDITGGKVPFFGSNWIDDWDVNLIFSLGTTVSLFDGGSMKAQIAQSRIQSQKAREGYIQLLDALEFQVTKSVEAVKGGFYKINEKEARARLAEEQYKNARVSFANELITREEELGARVAVIRAELELLVARFEYENSLAALEYLVGEL